MPELCVAPSPAAEALPASGAANATSSETAEGQSSSSPIIQFTGHSTYLVSLAQLCRDTNKYTDVTLQCSDGEIKAHRIVLASCSPFLRTAFLTTPQGLPEFTLMLPNVKLAAVKTLIDFLYTGQMTFARTATHQIQQLVSLLEIDPENVRVEVKSSPGCKPSPQTGSKSSGNGNKMVQGKITAMMNANSATPTTAKGTASAVAANSLSPKENHSPVPERVLSRSRTVSNSSGTATPTSTAAKSGPGRQSSLVEIGLGKSGQQQSGKAGSAQSSPADRTLKSVPLKNLKRKISNEANSPMASSSSPSTSSSSPAVPAPKELKLSSGLSSSSSSSGRGRGAPGGVRRRSYKPRGRPSTHPPSGFHDMARVETWVCAICKQYDPVLPAGSSANDLPITTEWIGCDCNRWYHQFCTKLKTVGDDFSCAQVKLTCLKALGEA